MTCCYYKAFEGGNRWRYIKVGWSVPCHKELWFQTGWGKDYSYWTKELYGDCTHHPMPFFYATKSKNISPGDIARSLMNTPRQCFGHHVACVNYCQADKLSNPAEHRFKNFPRGKNLQARGLQQFLGELFSPYVDVIPLCMLCNIYIAVWIHVHGYI